jgi:hypothetical protein
VPSEEGTEGNKQDVPKICYTLHSCITRLPREMLKRIVYIGELWAMRINMHENLNFKCKTCQFLNMKISDTSPFDVSGLCGQMHGIVFWKSKQGWELDGEKRIPKVTSNLYTWQVSKITFN